MAKEELIEMSGEILENLTNGMYLVKLENGKNIIGHIAGRMRKYRIKVAQYDKVTVEMTPYDLTKGRITFRAK